jgi:hypothetical protein
MSHSFNVNVKFATCFDLIVRSSSGIYVLSSSKLKLVVRIWIRIFTIGGGVVGCVAHVNILIKFIVKIMMRRCKDMKCKQYKGIKMGLDVAWIMCIHL